MVEVCSRLRHVELPFMDKNMRPYFKDVLDHVVRVNETIDGLREVLSFAFEAAHLLESSRQGEVSRKFAGWAAILAVPTAIAGIYGMNFEFMPELQLALRLLHGAGADLRRRRPAVLAVPPLGLDLRAAPYRAHGGRHQRQVVAVKRPDTVGEVG